MDAIKKKMQAMKLEKDNAMDRADACEQQAKDANLRAERVSSDLPLLFLTLLPLPLPLPLSSSHSRLPCPIISSSLPLLFSSPLVLSFCPRVLVSCWSN